MITRKRADILHIITLSENGGATENTALTMEGLAHCMNTHLACAPGGPLIKRASKAGVVVHPLRYMSKNMAPLRDSFAFLELYRLIKRLKPRIVHTHSSKAGFLGRLAAAAAGTSRVVHTVHGLPFHDFQPLPVHFLYRLAEIIAGRFTDRLVTVSPQVSEKAWRSGLAARKRIHTVFSGMNTKFTVSGGEEQHAAYRAEARLRLFEELGIGEHGYPVICTVGRAAPLKRLDMALEVMEGMTVHWPHALLIVVGDGPELPGLTRKARATGIRNRFFFIGSRDDVFEILSSSDLLIHTSLLEGLPRVLPEAMLARTPWIAFGVDGVRDASGGNSRGISVPPGDTDWMINAANAILSDEGARRVMVNRAYKWASKRYPAANMIRRLYSVYRDDR